MSLFTSMLAEVWTWPELALELAIYAGAWAGLLAAVVLAINLSFRRWLSARQMGLLWGIVLLRLLIPVAPASPLSLQNLLPSGESEASSAQDAQDRPRAAQAGYARSGSELTALNGYSPPVASSQARDPAEAVPTAVDLLIAAIPLAWLLGAVGSLVATALVHRRFCRRLKTAAKCDDPRLRALWEACCQLAAVRRSIPILLFDGVEQPAVLGALRPKLLLPEDAAELDDEQLRMVMLHELAHIRRWHVAANWLLVVIRAVHWWNPVYWVAAARFRSLREQSCDAFAIQRIGGQPTRRYGELLLLLAERQPPRSPWRVVLPASILGFFSSFLGKRAMHNRLRALQSAQARRNRWQSAGAAGLLALAAVCGLTDATMPTTSADESVDWIPRSFQNSSNWNAEVEVDTGPSVAHTYDFEKALKSVVAAGETEEVALAELKAWLLHILAASEGPFQAPGKPQRPEATVTIDGTSWTVTASAKAHDELSRNLRAWELGGLSQMCVETRFITDQRDITSALGIAWQNLEAFSDSHEEEFASDGELDTPVVRAKAGIDDYLPIVVATLDDEQASAFAHAAQDGRYACVLQAPKVTFMNGQRAILLDRTHVRFVVGVRDAGPGRRQPKIAVVDEGIRMSLRTVQVRETSTIQLEGRVELSEIGDVRAASTLVGGQPATIQIPRVKRCRIDFASKVCDGQSLLIGCMPAYEQRRFFYILLTVRDVAPTDI